MQSFLNNKIAVVLAVAVFLLGGAVVYQQVMLSRVANPDSASQEDLQKTIAAVGKLIYLPENETPTMATVSDPTKLQDQLFFAHAKKGDRVLIYAQAHKAILYDPVENKIVDVAPVNSGGAPQ